MPIFKRCENCKKEFKTKACLIRRNWGRFCSIKCRWAVSRGYWTGKKIPEVFRKKMSEAHIGLRGSHTGFRHSEETKRKIGLRNKNRHSRDYFKRISVLGIKKQQEFKEPTKIEKKIYEELEKRKLPFEKQKLINGKFLVDAYIPSLNLVIEADGNYWHSLPRVIKKDKSENAYLIKCGYRLLRLGEREILSGEFVKKLEG